MKNTDRMKQWEWEESEIDVKEMVTDGATQKAQLFFLIIELLPGAKKNKKKVLSNKIWALMRSGFMQLKISWLSVVIKNPSKE